MMLPGNLAPEAVSEANRTIFNCSLAFRHLILGLRSSGPPYLLSPKCDLNCRRRPCQCPLACYMLPCLASTQLPASRKRGPHSKHGDARTGLMAFFLHLSRAYIVKSQLNSGSLPSQEGCTHLFKPMPSFSMTTVHPDSSGQRSSCVNEVRQQRARAC